MVKAIFFDIDGTLVSFRTHSIPSSTINALNTLRAKGIKIFISTGRPKPSMMHAVGHLPFDGYVTLNGAYCFTADQQEIYKSRIPQTDIERLIRYHTQHSEVPFVLVDEEEWFITGINDDVKTVTDMVQEKIPDVRPIEEARNKNILQLIGYFKQEQDKYFFEEVLTHCTPMRWFPLFADIISTGNSKRHGIDTMIKHYGIKLEETMAFGDGGNDIPMLRHAGIGVAMGNSAPEVQSAADYVTTSVDEDGIQHALEHFNII